MATYALNYRAKVDRLFDILKFKGSDFKNNSANCKINQSFGVGIAEKMKRTGDFSQFLC